MGEYIYFNKNQQGEKPAYLWHLTHQFILQRKCRDQNHINQMNRFQRKKYLQKSCHCLIYIHYFYSQVCTCGVFFFFLIKGNKKSKLNCFQSMACMFFFQGKIKFYFKTAFCSVNICIWSTHTLSQWTPPAFSLTQLNTKWLDMELQRLVKWLISSQILN